MPKLKLTDILDDTPVKVTLELPAALHRDLVRYGELLGAEGSKAVDPAKLIAPMLARFMASDRGFASRRKARA